MGRGKSVGIAQVDLVLQQVDQHLVEGKGGCDAASDIQFEGTKIDCKCWIEDSGLLAWFSLVAIIYRQLLSRAT